MLDTMSVKIGETEFVGEIPIRQDINVLSANDPKDLKIGWSIYENTGPFFLPSDDNSCYDSDVADRFFGSWGIGVEKTNNFIWSVVPQLEFLWGQPWNNLALNYVMSLRPSVIRVSSGVVICDCMNWRVTIYLKKDNRTINRIEQECNVGMIGACCGHDLRLKLKQQVSGEKIEQFDVSSSIINNDALAKIEIE